MSVRIWPAWSRCWLPGRSRWSARVTPSPGKIGLVVQSGGVGAALVERFSRLGIGISSFASVGDKLDVSGTDLSTAWSAIAMIILVAIWGEVPDET